MSKPLTNKLITLLLAAMIGFAPIQTVLASQLHSQATDEVLHSDSSHQMHTMHGDADNSTTDNCFTDPCGDCTFVALANSQMSVDVSVSISLISFPQKLINQSVFELLRPPRV